MKQISALLILASFFLFHSCQEPTKSIPDEVMGMAPVYSLADFNEIKMLEAQKILQLGKIYYKDSLIFAGETGRGVHIIDNTDPTDPQKIKFLQIYGSSDIAIKGNILYANNQKDLVAIDISNLEEIKVLKRLEGIFPEQLDAPFPPDYFGFFECVDPSLGIVIGWEERLLQQPECWR